MRFLLLACFCLISLASSGLAERKPNIVFFFIDDLGWSDLACYGSEYHLTPNIDKLAASGVRFTDAYASCPVCSPTRAAIMTGKAPARLGITDWIGAAHHKRELICPKNVEHLPQAEVTFAEALKEVGYKTAYFGKWHLGKDDADHPSTQGFDYHRGVNRAGAPGSYHPPFRRKKPSALWDVPDFEDAPEDSYLTDLLADEAAGFIEKNKDDPFLVFLSHYSVHTPIQPREQDKEKFTARRDKLGLAEAVKLKPEKFGNTRITQNNPGYAAMVESVDRSVGRVLDTVEKLGLTKDTLVVFTSDNGNLSTLPLKRSAPACSLPLRAGKGWVYEGGIRVPAIVRWPGVAKAGTIDSTPIISTDFYPTLLAAAGLKPRPEQHRDGMSLLPVLKGEAGERPPLCWHFPHYHGSANRPSAALRSGKYKLVRWYEDGSEELYDLSADPAESKDLAKVQPEQLQKLSGDLDRWLKDVGARMAVPAAE